ncbi:hypothetical protein ACVBEG_27135 [Pseudomonas sp. GG8]
MPAPDEHHVQSAAQRSRIRRTPCRKARAAENWWIASYSALRIGDTLRREQRRIPDSRQRELFDDERLDPDALRGAGGGGDIHRFHTT